MTALYGLPENVEFCRLCTISNQRPSSSVEFSHTIESRKKTIHFEDGICDACRLAHKKKSTDWKKREEELRQLCDRHRSAGGKYDCIVPGSGGKDSFYAAWMLKYKYGMHPLTVTWRPHIYTEWGWRNHTRWIDAGFDNILFSPNGKTHRLLTRLAVDNLLHPFQPFIIGQKQLAPAMAKLYGVSLVFYGESEAEYGNALAESTTPIRDTKYFVGANDVRLGGVEYGKIIEDYGVAEADLLPYMPLGEWEGEVHYLGYYLKWHPQSCYFHAVEHGGFEPSPERTPGTYSKYNSIDDKIDDYHYYTTFIKFGIGRATYDSAQEIRSGDITREEGLALVKRYDGEYPTRFEQEIFDYLNVDGFPQYNRETFLAHCENFKSPHIWDGDKLRHTAYA